jgi:pyruvate dehydrogenase (quinone)
MARKVSDVFVHMLFDSGVRRIYGVPGDSLNALTDAIRRHERIEWVHMRHEEVGAFAAGAEAHLTGELAVCAGSCGPGNLHLINGLFDCHRSRVPVLAIAAQIPSSELGTNYFQETHPEILFRECSDYCQLVSEPVQLPRVLAIAMRTAITKRAVAVVVISGNILAQDCPLPPLALGLLQGAPIVVPLQAHLEKAAQILNAASKITILGGAGCQGAHDELIQTAARLKAPIVHALRGKEFIEYDNPYDTGMTGLLGFSSGYHAIMDCDALLMLGTDFPYRQFFPKDAKVLQVDLRGEQIGRRTHVELGLIGDVRHTLRALLPLLVQNSDDAHLKKSLAHYAETRKSLDELADGEPGTSPLHPQYLAKLIDELAAEDAVFTCDVGTPVIWAARYLGMNGKRRLLGSFNHGSMANALPQAIGAQAAFPKRQVISLSGDGGLTMLLGDLLTLPQMQLPVKVVVLNNGALGFVELEMKSDGYVTFGTDLRNPSFAKLADAIGLFTARVERPEELRSALHAAFDHNGPALVEVLVNRMELSMPPTITIDQMEGFTLYALRSVMSGRGDELLDLAKTNLLR